METLLLETLEKILKNNNIESIETIHQNNIIRHLHNEEYLTRLLLKFHEDIPYTKIYYFVKRNQKVKELINNYEKQIILDYLNKFKKHNNSRKYNKHRRLCIWILQ